MYENENSRSEQNRREINKDSSMEKWVKTLILALAMIFGTFLAVYFVSEQTMKYAYFGSPYHQQKIFKKMMKENMKTFGQFEKFESPEMSMFPPVGLSQMPISQLSEDENGYKLMINLKHFNNDVNNVKLDIKPDKVSILAASESENKTSIYSLSYSQTYVLDKKINPKKVVKEMQNENVVVYLPLADN